MAVSIKTEGSQSATVTTEHTLATVTDAGTYVLAVDLANMAKADEVVLRIKTKLTSGDSSQLAYEAIFANVQNEKNSYSIPVPSPIEFVASLTQTTGSSRTFIWVIYAL